MQSRFYDLIWLFAMWLFCSPVFAVDFIQVDFIKDLTEQPLYKQYDPKSGRFLNTESEIITKDKIQSKIEEYKSELSKLQEERNKVDLLDLVGAIGKDNLDWSHLADIERNIKDIKNRIEEQEKFMKEGGIPAQNSIFNVIEKLNKNILSQYEKSDTVYINRLPRYTRNIPRIYINNFSEGYYRFLQTNSINSFNLYVSKAPVIGMMFPIVSNSILYKRENK